MFPVLRLLIGLVFLVSGAEKIMGHYQNFLYIIQAYEVLPGWAEELTARFFPWIELFTGIFLVLGLWVPWALRSALLMFAGFIVIVGQALLRGLPLEQCGCFGELIHVPPQVIIVCDSAALLFTAFLLRHPLKARAVSLDRYFEK